MYVIFRYTTYVHFFLEGGGWWPEVPFARSRRLLRRLEDAVLKQTKLNTAKGVKTSAGPLHRYRWNVSQSS